MYRGLARGSHREYRCWCKGVGAVVMAEKTIAEFWIDKLLGWLL